MELNEILNQISIGYNNSDEKSERMKKYVDMVKTVLEQSGALVENKTLSFKTWDDTSGITTGSQIFYQGSYATHTAIKSSKYDVDVDIAFYIDEHLPTGIRGTVFDLLKNGFSEKYSIELKKPCITIDFNDGYKIDVTLYSKSEEQHCLSFHNSINGIETQSLSKPKTTVKSINNYLKSSEFKRPVIRLMKHFCKNTTSMLEIEDENKIPSIAIILIAMEKYNVHNKEMSEETLYEETKKINSICKDYLLSNRVVENKALLINNVLYKVNDFEKVLQVFKTIELNLEAKNYSAIVSKNVAETINKKNPTTPSFLGTMGKYE